MKQIEQVTFKNNSIADESAREVEKLKTLSDDLAASIDKFKLFIT